MDTKYFPLFSTFAGSSIFIGTVTSMIFGQNNWQLTGSLIAGAVCAFLLHRNIKH